MQYCRASTIAEAEALLDRCAGAQPLAGGHDLLPAIKSRTRHPVMLVDLQDIAELRGITRSLTHVSIGAMTCHAEVAASVFVRESLPGLAAMVGEIGDPQVRNRATIGGAAAANATGSDYPAALLAVDARFITNRRIIAADDFFPQAGSTALQRAEILQQIELPIADGAAYVKIPSPASRDALTGVFVARFGSRVRIAVTGACANVFRATGFEDAVLNGSTLASVDLGPAEFISDIFGDGEYRRALVKVAAERAISCTSAT